MLETGKDSASQEKDAVSPTSRGAVDIGCWEMIWDTVENTLYCVVGLHGLIIIAETLHVHSKKELSY